MYKNHLCSMHIYVNAHNEYTNKSGYINNYNAKVWAYNNNIN